MCKKRATEDCSSRKSDNEDYPTIIFNSANFQSAANQKPLGLILKSKPDSYHQKKQMQ